MHKTKPICLLIDDDDDDQLIFETTIHKYFSNYAFVGVCAFDDLEGMCMTIDINQLQRIVAIFLDLNMPKTNGVDILKWIKSHPVLKNTPVMIYSTSKNPTDKIRCQQLGAKGFVSKPSKIKDLVRELELVL